MTAVYLQNAPLKAVAIYVAAIARYAAFGLLIHVRQLPSIIVTLGMSFVWLGTGDPRLARPGRRSAGLAQRLHELAPAVSAPADLAGHLGSADRSSRDHALVFRTDPARRRRPTRARSNARDGRSLAIRVGVYAAAGALTCIAGLALTGLTTSGDPNVAPAYTLQGVGAVILGGGSFSGGVVSPVGTVIGALTLSLAGSLLSFLQVPPTWQIGAQGAILFLVLAGRILLSEKTK